MNLLPISPRLSFSSIPKSTLFPIQVKWGHRQIHVNSSKKNNLYSKYKSHQERGKKQKFTSTPLDRSLVVLSKPQVNLSHPMANRWGFLMLLGSLLGLGFLLSNQFLQKEFSEQELKEALSADREMLFKQYLHTNPNPECIGQYLLEACDLGKDKIFCVFLDYLSVKGKLIQEDELDQKYYLTWSDLMKRACLNGRPAIIKALKNKDVHLNYQMLAYAAQSGNAEAYDYVYTHIKLEALVSTHSTTIDLKNKIENIFVCAVEGGNPKIIEKTNQLKQSFQINFDNQRGTFFFSLFRLLWQKN